MLKNLFSKKTPDDKLAFDRREFVLFWMVAAYKAGIPGEISAHQMDLFGEATGIDFESIVITLTQEEFDGAVQRFDAAVSRNKGN